MSAGPGHAARLRRCLLGTLVTLAGVALAAPGAADASLQERIDAAAPGALLRLEPGDYQGPIVIRRSLVLDGGGQARIDAGGRGSVVRILADGVTLRGLRLSGSGESHDDVDSGVQVVGHRNVIEDNVIEDCLFGLDLAQSNDNVVQRNTIGSKPLPLGVKGDGIRLWYSRNNQILENHITDVRDVVVWYAGDNLIARNVVIGGRYGLHFMYAQYNRVEDNRFTANTVGVFVMYSDGVELLRNRVEHSDGPTGMGIGFKESSEVHVEGNTILNCATGMYLDVSPYEPDTENRFTGNRIAYNAVGIVFHSDWQGNVFRDNEFAGNFSQVVVRGGGGATRHVWEGNRWDDYEGFDRDQDGRGDTPYELYAYADRFWVDRPFAAFFRGSPLFEAVDFLDRLAPFTTPTLLLRDSSPRFRFDGPLASAAAPARLR